MSRLLTQKHEDEIDVKEVWEADGGTDGFWQGNTEESGLVKDGNGLYHANSCMGLVGICGHFSSHSFKKKKEEEEEEEVVAIEDPFWDHFQINKWIFLVYFQQ